MTGCVIAVLAAALLAYLLATSWSRPTTAPQVGTTPRQTLTEAVFGLLKIGALLALAVVVLALMAVSVAHTRPHR
jgi:Na+/melibiose symporter-like transporter